MAVSIDLQNDLAIELAPDIEQFSRWVKAALEKEYENLEQTIRIVDEAEIKALNSQYRNKDSSTNILSFLSEIPHVDYYYLGDLVICAPVVITEANQQGKDVTAHWAHLVVHGMLHLQGYDHESAFDAEKMEALEVKILSTLGYSNPYNNN